MEIALFSVPVPLIYVFVCEAPVQELYNYYNYILFWFLKNICLNIQCFALFYFIIWTCWNPRGKDFYKVVTGLQITNH